MSLPTFLLRPELLVQGRLESLGRFREIGLRCWAAQDGVGQVSIEERPCTSSLYQLIAIVIAGHDEH